MDYEAMKKDRFTRNTFSHLLGVYPGEVHEGYAEAFLPVKPEFLNINGSIHGGVLFTLSDVTANAAAVTYGDIAVTSTADYNYLNAAADASLLRAEAYVIKRGRRIITVECKLYDEKGKILTASIMTFCTVS